MTEAEFASWMAYYRLWPFDDYHRFHRPAALVSASLSGELDAKLKWLGGEAPGGTHDAAAGLNEVDRSVFRAMGGG
jgi:hypothetical protein